MRIHDVRPRLEPLEDRALPAVSVQFDYRFDTRGFFNDPARRAALQQAANSVTAPINDTLLEIRPSGGNKWNAVFNSPSTGSLTQVANLVVPADRIIVFVGGRDLSRSDGTWQLAAADNSWEGPSSNSSGTAKWHDLVAGRGQAGALTNGRTDTSTWGGSIAFDTGRTPWHFGAGGAAVPAGRYDFYSAAVREIGHILGFSDQNPAFGRYRQYPGPRFVGPAALRANNGVVPPLNVQGGTFWANGFLSGGRPPAMSKDLPTAQSRPFTRLDFAALADVGWQVQMSQAATFRDGVWTATDPAGGPGATRQFRFGLPGDVPVTGDWNGDGRTDFGVVRNGYQWFLNTNPYDPFAYTYASFGLPGDVPVTGDWNGDGVTDIGVVRNGYQWFLNTRLGDPFAYSYASFGLPGDVAVTGDWNGDRITDIGVVRGGTQWYLNTQFGNPFAYVQRSFGLAGDVPVVGDWNGDGVSDLGVVRRGSDWYLDLNGVGGAAERAIRFGVPGERHVAGWWV